MTDGQKGLLMLALSMVSIAFKTAVLWFLWHWYATGFGLPVIGPVRMFGVALFLDIATYRATHPNDDQLRQLTERLGVYVIALVLGFVLSFALAP